MNKIAVMRTDFPDKFGIPRQSGLSDARGRIVFEPEYRNPDALRGLEEYSHLWILWEFSEAKKEKWSPTVRPPRLGGNKRVGVFATRSPFRPNSIGLSCVRLEKIEASLEEGMVILVSGIDMMDGTPIYDVKPYLPYVDAIPDARGGFAEQKKEYCLEVVIPEECARHIPMEQLSILRQILSQDPRPSYQKDPKRIYGMEYADMEIKFQVEEQKLLVCSIEKK